MEIKIRRWEIYVNLNLLKVRNQIFENGTIAVRNIIFELLRVIYVK